MRTYTELVRLPTFIERFRYLKLNGKVGEDTFGFDRWLNQVFYHSREWKEVQRYVALRDNGCDLAHPDRQIQGRFLVHHMNPITERDIIRREDILLNPEYLVLTVLNTHNAIHYGDETLLIPDAPAVRKPNDTCPWR